VVHSVRRLVGCFAGRRTGSVDVVLAGRVVEPDRSADPAVLVLRPAGGAISQADPGLVALGQGAQITRAMPNSVAISIAERGRPARRSASVTSRAVTGDCPFAALDRSLSCNARTARSISFCRSFSLLCSSARYRAYAVSRVPSWAAVNGFNR
jgi:hypothetical protein